MSEIINDFSEYKKSKCGNIGYRVRETKILGFVSKGLIIKIENLMIDCKYEFIQLSIPFEKNESRCWYCGKQRYILVSSLGFKSRQSNFSECCGK